MCLSISGLQVCGIIKNYFPYLSTKTYVVGTQKNHLNEMVLLNTQNICLDVWKGKKKSQFYAKYSAHHDLCPYVLQ